MSVDLLLDKKCNHLIVNELVEAYRDGDHYCVELMRPVISLICVYYLREPVSGATLVERVSFDVDEGWKGKRTIRLHNVVFKLPTVPYKVITVEISYYTDPFYCPICLGRRDTKVYDLVYNNGHYQLIGGKDKLAQEIDKLIMTTVGTCRYLPWYGSRLKNFIGATVVDRKLLVLEIEQDILYDLNVFKKLQEQASFMTKYDDDEVIGIISGVDAKFDGADPTLLDVYIYITTLGGLATEIKYKYFLDVVK